MKFDLTETTMSNLRCEQAFPMFRTEQYMMDVFKARDIHAFSVFLRKEQLFVKDVYTWLRSPDHYTLLLLRYGRKQVRKWEKLCEQAVQRS